MSTEQVTADMLRAADAKRVESAIAFQIAMQEAARSSAADTSGAGELARLRVVSELADDRYEVLREALSEQERLAAARAQREADCRSELAGMTAELRASRAGLVKRMTAAQAALTTMLAAATDYSAAVTRAGADLAELGLGSAPGEHTTVPLGRAGVMIAGERYANVDPAAVLSVIAGRAAVASLGQRNSFSLLQATDIHVGELKRSGMLDGVPEPKRTFVPPPPLPSRAILPAPELHTGRRRAA